MYDHPVHVTNVRTFLVAPIPSIIFHRQNDETPELCYLLTHDPPFRR